MPLFSRLIRSAALLISFLFTHQLTYSQTISISDFGVKPDTYENITPRIQKIIDEAITRHSTKLIFPKGRYDFWPDGAIRAKYFVSNTSTEEEDSTKIKTIGMLFKNAKNLTIDGNGSLFIFHGKMTTIVLDQCENVILQNIHVDFERPTMSEMRYVKVSAQGVDLEIHPDAKYSISNGQLIWHGEGWKTTHFHGVEFDTTMKTMRYSDWKILNNSKATELRPNLVHFDTPSDFKPKQGNILTVRDIIRDQVGMLILQSKNIKLEDVGMHYMHGLGIVSQYTENITMHRVTCAPREETKRIIASSADFMHFSGCRGQITVEDCKFSGAHDDPINIHGTNLRMIEKINKNRLKLRFMHGQSYGFNAFSTGDTVAFVHAATMIRFEKGIVKTVERVNDRDIILTFQSVVPAGLEAHDCVENMTWTPQVFIKNNYFTRTNTRGILLTTPRKAVVESNIFYRTGMSAILIEADAEGWYESGPVRDVTIRNNQFIDCAYQGGPGNAVIGINPSNKIADFKKPVHSNIRIENNVFTTFDFPVLYAKSTQGLIFSRNTIIRSNTLPAESDNKKMFYFNGCSQVEITNTKMSGDVLGKNIKTENMPKTGLKVTGSKRLSIE
ncbi:right-handed parallel beta-helix repeat-containing protein [Dyadobacter subterraneus]|uniref:Right-handed parallel beta-helix repeat-containing protein n=1 Tax=Dyadobacter subterraneus TaxID=2773304 RepID=A0ABR9WBX9_9BACT|nr:right-handed parallel beta-helix repeat-containing protein [Dyadobacter subterraneus]MBE9461734.1 right-handed parallel beta-helix repeat-containing protein [Dyadobacter subterraneus]